MKATKQIIFDLDDTLCDLKEPLCNALNKLTRTNKHWSTWDSFNITDNYKISLNAFYKCIIDNNLLENLEPYKDTKRLLTGLKKNGYTIIIITSRAYHPKAYNVTKEWFDKYEIPYDIIHITGHGKEKSDYIKSYDNIMIAIDDRIENCESFIRSGKIKYTLLYTMPWNIKSDIPRIKNLSEMVKFI